LLFYEKLAGTMSEGDNLPIIAGSSPFFKSGQG